MSSEHSASDEPTGYRPIACVDASDLSKQMQGWNFEFEQLSPGALTASGGMMALNCVLVAQLTLDQVLLRRGHAPRGSVAALIPGSASSQAFVRGRMLEPTQCIAMSGDASVEVITRRDYVDVALAVDLQAWRGQSQWLSECALATSRASWIAKPGQRWINRMRRTVRWLFTAIQQYPQALSRLDVRASLADQVVMALADLGSEQADTGASSSAPQSSVRASTSTDSWLSRCRSPSCAATRTCRHARSNTVFVRSLACPPFLTSSRCG
jgi:hypothetical protein